MPLKAYSSTEMDYYMPHKQPYVCYYDMHELVILYIGLYVYIYGVWITYAYDCHINRRLLHIVV